MRASPDSRLGDIVALTAVLLAWAVWRLWTLGGVAKFVVRPMALIVLLLTLASAVTYGRVIPRVGGVGVNGPTNFVRRLSGVGGLYARRPLDCMHRRAQRPRRLSRWLNECTHDSARVALIGFEPQVFFLSERGFAAGWRFTISAGTVPTRIRRSSSSAGPDSRFRSCSPWIRSGGRSARLSRDSCLDRYALRCGQQSAFDGGKPLTVLVDKSLARVL